MSERETSMAGYRFAAEAMVQAHDEPVGAAAELVSRVVFAEWPEGAERATVAERIGAGR